MLLALGCTGAPNATFELDVPSSLAKNAAWYEIGLFAGTCPSQELLVGGIPLAGTSGRIAFAAGTAVPPGLGRLSKATYGVAAVALAADCSVIGTGCATTTVNGGGSIAVTVSPVSGTPAGSCESGSICKLGACVPGSGSGVAAGTACSMQLVGAGPLADPLSQQGVLLSAPAIAATPSGFLVAYREVDPNQGNARLTAIALDPSAAASAPVQTPLKGACLSNPATDATALAFDGANGTIVVSHPTCAGASDGGTSPGGVDLFAIDEAGHVKQSAFSGHAGLDLTLAQSHALATTPLGLLLAYTNQSTQASFAAAVSGLSLATSPAPIPFGGFSAFADVQAALVAGSDVAAAFLALGTASLDGGMQPGSSAALATVGQGLVDGGVPAGYPFPAIWASASGAGSRIIVAANDPAASDIAWTAFDVGSTAPTTSGTIAPQSGGAVSYADVALYADRAFFAASVGADVSLFAFEKASTNPLELLEVTLSSLPTVPLGALRDGLVAVAASDTRVAVVWGTGKTLGNDDAVGGYALFACGP